MKRIFLFSTIIFAAMSIWVSIEFIINISAINDPSIQRAIIALGLSVLMFVFTASLYNTWKLAKRIESKKD